MLFKYVEKYVFRHRANKHAALLKAKESDVLRRYFPMLPRSRADVTLRAIEEEYTPFYKKYVTEVSIPREAIALEQATLMAYLTRTMPVTSVMDTGSGFSTFVLRREATKKGGIRHLALEDNSFWLGKTRDYLASQGLPTDNVVEWKDFQAQGGDGQFDLVFCDMGSTTTRILSLPLIKQSTSENGLLVLDDMHKSHYAPHALEVLGKDWIAESMIELTRDQFGRFAYVSRRRTAAEQVK